MKEKKKKKAKKIFRDVRAIDECGGFDVQRSKSAILEEGRESNVHFLTREAADASWRNGLKRRVRRLSKWTRFIKIRMLASQR